MKMSSATERETTLALAFLPKFNSAVARLRAEYDVPVSDFLTMPRAELSRLFDCDPRLLPDEYERGEALFRARHELQAYDNYRIKVLLFGQEGYPNRLLASDDAPPVLFQLGDTDLDANFIVSVVGTRKPTPYGENQCRKLVAELAEAFPGILIVSGLAYGIDACAHKAALEAGCPTVGVLAHGLHKVYPPLHRQMATAMVRSNGSLLSQYPLGEEIYRQRFLERNLIVASMADATVIVESPLKGGAMSTATAAFNANREVLAFPGRVGDERSEGCNLLIRKEKAHLITGAADLIEFMGWQPEEGMSLPVERSLFPELEGDAKTIHEVLRQSSDPVHIDRLHQVTLLAVGRILAALGELEYDGIVLRHPGNKFSLA